MKIDQVIIDKIKNIIDKLDNNFNYIVIGGSISIKYIKNNKDIDVFVFCKDQKQVELCNSIIDRNGRKELRSNYNVDIHIAEKWDDNFIYTLNQSWKYLADFPDNLIEAFKDIIIKPINIDEFIESGDIIKSKIKRFIDRRIEFTNIEDRIYLSKYWYYIYLIEAILKNKSFDLTDEQIINVNMLHDRKQECLSKRKELIDSMIKEIKLWQI